jgi:hypothetical protein
VDHACERPVGLPFIGGLVIAIPGVCFARRLARGDAALDDILAESNEWPNWGTGSEFRAIRDETAVERKPATTP